jgi:hypothetical protein
MALYCDSLSILRSHVPSVEILQELGPFLAAGFARIPPPSLGPLAFGDFWRATYHGLAQFYSVYPESIIDCLKALDQAFKLEGDLRLGLSLDSDSQLTVRVDSYTRYSWLTYSGACSQVPLFLIRSFPEAQE